MFTGIIESLGTISNIAREDKNVHFTVKSNISAELKIDQSLSHNGVCLTVIACNNEEHTVTAIHETLLKSNLGNLSIGDTVNLERCLIMNGRLDGHIVKGHVDTTANCTAIEEQGGSRLFTFEYEKKSGHITVEKGSVCVNGISLTVVNSEENKFSVVIIPYTLGHTNMQNLQIGDSVNIEFDIIGKYVAKLSSSNF